MTVCQSAATAVASVGLALALATAGSPAAAQGDIIGQAEFRRQCAVCHGMDGMGQGPLAALLSVDPGDLTQLAIQNKGRFPTERIYRTIDGRYEVQAHGTRVMPVWGDRYRKEAENIEGLEGVPKVRERIVAGRILELVFYLQSIQVDE
ncbi:MAG: c-type cytochrome [Alphaproteobacteria bacterium]|nr:c-type cytochrome [Alphaproteobacteria bacterium]